MNKVLIVILTFGLAIRLVGITHGLPYGLDLDESSFTWPALLLFQGKLDPAHFRHPGAPLIYSLHLLYRLYLWIKPLNISSDQMPGYYFDHPTLFLLIGRLLSLTAGLGIIFLTYQIGKRFFSPLTGAVAAFLTAINPLLVDYSQVVRTDLLVTCLILAAILAIKNLADSGEPKDYLFSGLLVGLAIATKYPAVALIYPLIVGHLISRRRSSFFNRRFLSSIIWIAIGFFLTTPFFLKDPGTMVSNLAIEFRTEQLGATSESELSTLVWYLSALVNQTFGLAGGLLSLIGLGLVLKASSQNSARHRLILLSFLVYYLILISFHSLRWHRWLIPLIPFQALFVGWSIEMLHRSRSRLLTILLILLISLPPTYVSFRSVRKRTKLDTRILAQLWLTTHIRPGARLAVEGKSRPLSTKQYQVFCPDLDRLTQLHHGQICEDSLAVLGQPSSLRDQGVEFMVLSDFNARYQAQASRYPEKITFYQNLKTQSQSLYQIIPSPAHPGLSVEMRRLNLEL